MAELPQDQTEGHKEDKRTSPGSPQDQPSAWNLPEWEAEQGEADRKLADGHAISVRHPNERPVKDARSLRTAPARSPKELALAIAQSLQNRQGQSQASQQAHQQAPHNSAHPNQYTDKAELTSGQVSEAEELDLRPPTAEELGKIREQAVEEGRLAGLEEGRTQGHEEGYQQGHRQGLEDGKAEGLKEGRTQGLEEGKAKGQQDYQQQIDQQLAKLNALSGRCQLSLLEKDAELPSLLSQLILGCCRKVLHHELAVTNSERLQDFMRRALDQLPETSASAIRVRISTDEELALKALIEESEGHWPGAEDWPTFERVDADPSLNPGELSVETSDTQIHYRVSEHLEAVLEDLEQQLNAAAPSNEERQHALQSELEQAQEPREAENPCSDSSTDLNKQPDQLSDQEGSESEPVREPEQPDQPGSPHETE
jgi:flagellar assembly protein FliH